MRGCRPLKNDEITALLALLAPREKVLALTGLTFGLRISEMLDLTFGMFAGDYLEVRHSRKKSNNATFPIPATYKQALTELRKAYKHAGFAITNDSHVFLNYTGKPITRMGLHRHLKKACALLGFTGTVNTHSFRKNFVTKIYELTGHNLAQTKVYSRHKSLSNLDYYIEVSRETTLVNDLAW